MEQRLIGTILQSDVIMIFQKIKGIVQELQNSFGKVFQESQIFER